MAKRDTHRDATPALHMEQISLEQLYEHPDNDYPADPRELDELCASIREDGLAQLPLVRPMGDGYQIIAGHRRVACYRRLAEKDATRWGAVPCNVSDDCDDTRAMILLDATNLMTRQLSVAERARRYERLWKSVPALRETSPELKGVRTSQVISDIISRETGQSVSRATIDRAIAAGRKAKEVSKLADEKAERLAPEWHQEIKQREGFTPAAVREIAARSEEAQHNLWADYQREELTPSQMSKRLEHAAPKDYRDVERALDQVIGLLRDVSAWNKQYAATVDTYRLNYIRNQLDRLSVAE